MRALPIAAAAALAATSAYADVKIHEKSQMTFTMLGTTTVRSDSVETISAEKVRRESDMDYEGGMMGMMPDQKVVEIQRPDLGVVWTLDEAKKSYRESDMGQMKAMLAGQSGDQKKKVRLENAEVTVKAPPGRKTINGYDCSRYILTMKLDMKDTDSGALMSHTIVQDLWNTRATGAVETANKERMAANRARLKAMGWEVDQADWARGMEAMMGMAGIDGKELARAMKKAEPELRKISGFPILMETDWKQKTEGGAENEGAGGPPVDPMAALGGMFGGGAKGGAGTGKGETPSFLKSRTEVVKVETQAAAPADFEIPTGYAKAK